jgi:hypothetical protein
MSRFRTLDKHVSHSRFATLPQVGDAPEVSRRACSLEEASVSSASGVSSKRRQTLHEGDLVTGTVDVAHERAQMLAAIRAADKEGEKRSLVRTFFLLLVSQLSGAPFPGAICYLIEDCTTGLDVES